MASVRDDYTPYLLADSLDERSVPPAEAEQVLTSAGLADWRTAHQSLLRLADGLPTRRLLAACLPALLAALSNTAGPDRALVNLERLTRSLPDPVALWRALAEHPRRLEVLVTLFAGSQFLSEILLRHPEYLEQLHNPQALAQPQSAAQFEDAAYAALAEGIDRARSDSFEEPLNALRRFQRWELLRIGICDLLGLLPLPSITAQLSNLADSLVRTCLTLVSRQAHITAEGLIVIALGKLGGGELNYSSDIDLLFLTPANPTLHQRLGERLIDALARVTAEGFLYRVDMRLRPWGQVGPLVSTLEGYKAYLSRHARLWEKQALLKARVIAGNESLGREFLRDLSPRIFALGDEDVRAGVHELKMRIESELCRRGCEWREVKLGKGSIRDVEFVTQYLQLIHGDRHPEVRSPNTLDALARLSAYGLLPPDEYRVLADGYTFLRPVEHSLQVMDYQQTHLLPEDPRELSFLARRLGFQGTEAGAAFLARYQQHCAAIRAVYQHYLEGENKMPNQPPPPPDIRRHVARMAPSYEETFSEAEIKRHAELAEQVDHANPVRVEAVPREREHGNLWRVTIVGYDYPGELSVICGLLFAYGFSIRDGHVFTYEPLEETEPRRSPLDHRPGERRVPAQDDPRRKIVDVFNVSSILKEVSDDVWDYYRHDLETLLHLLQAGKAREVHGELAKRAAEALRNTTGATTVLQPIEIEIDNETSERYTVLRIEAPDTIGFLYEFTNALAVTGIYIAQVTITSEGNHAYDTLYLTDSRGQKIVAPEKQRELRAATLLVKHFTHLLPHSLNPESALLHFRELLGQLFLRPDWPDELASLERPEVLSALARLLGVSDFLWDDFLRMQHSNLFPVVRDVNALSQSKTKAQWRAELDAALQAAPDREARRAALNAFKDREMFRVDMRHIEGHLQSFDAFSAELTDLAEVVVEAAYHMLDDELRQIFGTPQNEDDPPGPSALSICALGKCGGRELGYASDIELMFVFAANGKTTGPQVITSAEYYEKLVVEFTQAIRAKREGIFEIDLQLRPYGKAGSLAVSLESFRRYFGPGGPAWPYERQALIKLRPIAGDEALGAQLVALRDAFVYHGEAFNVAAMRAMRERQVRHLVTAGTLNAKYSPGALVDVEYLVQGLQIRYGRDNPALRLTNTGQTIEALAGVLSPDDYAQLRDAHTFFRQLIDALRMVRGNAKDLTVPAPESEDMVFLSRRLGYDNDLLRLRDELTNHLVNVQKLSARLLGAE